MARGPIICSATETISLVIGTTQYISFTQPDLNVGAPSLSKGSLLHLREAIGGHYVPATVLPAGLATRSDLTQNDLDNLAVEFESRDDVWSREFLSGEP